MRIKLLGIILTATVFFTAASNFVQQGGLGLEYARAKTGSDKISTEWWNFRNNEENNGVLNLPTPTNVKETCMKWQTKIGLNDTDSCTPPLILDGKIYTGAKRTVYMLNRKTGKVIKKSPLLEGGLGYAMNPMCYAKGMIFIQIGNGQVQALDAKTLKSLWVTEKLGGQTLSPITYKDGYIYTGYWKSETKDGDFCCYSIKDEDTSSSNEIKKPVWKFAPGQDDGVTPRGFYWAGAYASRKYVAVGSDDGDYNTFASSGFKKNAVFYILDRNTGKIIDKVENVAGDIRSTAVFHKEHLYFTTKGGELWKVRISDEGKVLDTSSINMGGMMTASPIVHNGRIYAGVAGKGGQFDADGGHFFAVVQDTTKLSQDSLVYTVPVKGYPQAAALLSKRHSNVDFDRDGKADKKVYLYFTYNAPPGGIYYLTDKPGQTEGRARFMYKPERASRQYCISTISSDKFGRLYYKNDTGNLICVETNKAYAKNIKITTDAGKASFEEKFEMGVLGYDVEVSPKATKAKIKVILPKGMYAKSGKKKIPAGGLSIKLGQKDKKRVSVSVYKGKAVRTYIFNIVRKGGSTELTDMKVSTSNAYGQELLSMTPAFQKEIEEYVVEAVPKERKFVNLWLEPDDPRSSISVIPDEGVSERNLVDGKIPSASSEGKAYRYPIYFKEGTEICSVLVKIFDREHTDQRVYKVVFKKGDTAVQSL